MDTLRLRLRLSLLLALALAHPCHAQDGAAEPLASPTTGMDGEVLNLVLPGSQLEPKALEDTNSPIVLRVVQVFPHVDDWRYDLSFYGTGPGQLRPARLPAAQGWVGDGRGAADPDRGARDPAAGGAGATRARVAETAPPRWLQIGVDRGGRVLGRSARATRFRIQEKDRDAIGAAGQAGDAWQTSCDRW